MAVRQYRAYYTKANGHTYSARIVGGYNVVCYCQRMAALGYTNVHYTRIA
jgi:hypothetical protein